MENEKKVQLVISAVDEMTGTLQGLQKELKSFGKEIDTTAQHTNRSRDAFSGLHGAAGLLRDMIPTIGVAMLARDLLQAGIAADKMRNSMTAATGSLQGLTFVRQEAMRLGLDLESATAGYIKLAAAAKGTAMEGETMQRVFTGMATASTALGLTGEETNRVLSQLAQMTSKGKVEMEDLKTVSESLPGTMNLAARAMGLTNSELFDMMKKGQLITSDFLPKFAEQVQKDFPLSEAAAHSLGAEINRLKTSFFDLKTTVMTEGGGSSIFATMSRDMQGGLTFLQQWVRELSSIDAKGLEHAAVWFQKLYQGQIGIMTGKNPFTDKPKSALEGYQLTPQDIAGGIMLGEASEAWRKNNQKAASGGKAGKAGSLFTSYDLTPEDRAGAAWLKESTTRDADMWGAFAAAPLNFSGGSLGPYSPAKQPSMSLLGPGGLDTWLADAELERQARYSLVDAMFTAEEMREQEMYAKSKAQRAEQLAWEQASNQTKLKWASSGFQSMGSMAESFYSMSNKKARWAFEAAKVMKIGETVTNTASAAMGAYNAMASIPYVGPALGAAAAAAAVAAGAAQIATINSQTPDGGSMPSATLPGGGTYGGGTPSSPIVTQPLGSASQPTPPQIIVQIHGNVIGQEKWMEESFAPEMRRLLGRNVDFGIATT